MGARDPHDHAVRTLRRHTEWVALALDDERGDLNRIELLETTFLRPAGRVERKGEAQNGDRIGHRGGATGDPRTQRPAPGQDGHAAECVLAELGDDRAPSHVELARWSRAASSGYPIGLLHECDGESLGAGGFGRADKVGRLDTAAGPVPEDERADG